MRHVALPALVLAIGCYGESVRPPEEPAAEPGPEGTEIEMPIGRTPRTAELDTDRTRPIAKSVEWPNLGTEEGDSYLEDAVVVDEIFRHSAGGDYGVRVRLKNATPQLLRIEYLIRFTDRRGASLLGHTGGGGPGERWTGLVLEPFGTATAADFARAIGAEGFRLFVRKAGSKTEGLPDDPAGKEERRRKREEAEARSSP
ncbi:MAG TPA: hypothetical protein VNO22_10710 [Planctomycetota bacterium]|nr:hypothetical protein [Planctomycetota bacterium]